MLISVAQYTEPADLIQRVCNHQAEIIALSKDNRDLKVQLFQPPTCNQAVIWSLMKGLENDSAEVWRRPAIDATLVKLQAD